jgi:hypothetical protein
MAVCEEVGLPTYNTLSFPSKYVAFVYPGVKCCPVCVSWHCPDRTDKFRGWWMRFRIRDRIEAQVRHGKQMSSGISVYPLLSLLYESLGYRISSLHYFERKQRKSFCARPPNRNLKNTAERKITCMRKQVMPMPVRWLHLQPYRRIPMPLENFICTPILRPLVVTSQKRHLVPHRALNTDVLGRALDTRKPEARAFKRFEPGQHN